MAIIPIPLTSSMQIRYKLGIDDEGKDKYVTRSLTGLKTDFDDQEAFDLVLAITSLQESPVTAVYRLDKKAFDEE